MGLIKHCAQNVPITGQKWSEMIGSDISELGRFSNGKCDFEAGFKNSRT
jgi:hypothetical protein